MIMSFREKRIQKKTIRHFIDHAEPYTKIADMWDHPVIVYLSKHTNSKQNLLEVGGANGNFLDNIWTYTPIRSLYNVEFAFKAYSSQVNKNIYLIGGSIDKLPFKDCTFDYVIIGDVFHHLVSTSRKKSKQLVIRGVAELIRVTKSNGTIIIGEACIKYKFFGIILFYITLLLSYLEISFKYFDIHKNVIVSLLTPEEIRDLLTNHKIEIKYEKIKWLKKPLRYRITLLLQTGTMWLFGIKK